MEASLKAELRNDLGSRSAKKLRESGIVPGVLYGKGEEVKHVTLNQKELESYFVKIAKRKCKLELAGSSLDVEIKEVQRHPISRDVLHIDFSTSGSKE